MNTIMADGNEGAVPSTTISLGRFADGDLITRRELCKCLGCSARTLQRMAERFEIPPPMTLGGRKVWLAGKSGHGLSVPSNGGRRMR